MWGGEVVGERRGGVFAWSEGLWLVFHDVPCTLACAMVYACLRNGY